MLLIQDLKYAFRSLRKSPGYALAALLVMALGIGANTSIFTVVNAVLLRPLPFGNPAQLVRIWHTPPQSSFPGVKIFSVSAANFLDWQRENNVFEQMSISAYSQMNLTGSGEPQALVGEEVSSNYFSVLEAKPFLGRTFAADEDKPGQNHSVILSYATWKTQFAANRNIVGKQITLNEQSYDVVGVMGPEFRFPDFAKIWTPMGMTPAQAIVRGEHHYTVVARLKPGVDVKQAQAAMDTLSQQLAQQYPADDKGWGAVVIPLREAIVGDSRPALLVLLGAVGFVLLIACANVANLTLVRTIARSKEVAIRTALGATRWQVIRQVMAESVLLSLFGGLLGILLSVFGTNLIVKVLGDQLPRFHEIALDTPVLLFTLGLSVLTGLLAGLLPALRSTNANPNDALKQGLGRTSADAGPERARGVLVIVEVALSLVLLFGAGLMMRTLAALHNVNPGFESTNVLTFRPSVGISRFENATQQAEFTDRLVQRLQRLPGVQAVGTVDSLPTQGGSMQPVGIEGRPVLAMADQPEVGVRVITPGYRTSMHIPLVRGRDFSASDNAQAPGVAMISQSMAKRFWPGEDPIGKHVTLTFFDKQLEVVGVIGDVKLSELNSPENDDALYFPSAQFTLPNKEKWRSFLPTFVIRSATRPEDLIPAVTGAVNEVDSSIPVQDMKTMDEVVGESIAQQHFTMLLLEVFAGLALLLAAVGIYSVLAYSVRRRMREIGIRMALGALPSQVLRMVVLQGLRPTVIGLVVGVLASLAVGRVMTSIVFGVKSTDPITFAAAAVVLFVVSLLASALPGYRAMKVEPMKTLRDE
ncbi:MAG TPA: ABC transporter permease [Candidatus Koribacter sp.]